MKLWYSAAELADLALPGFPETERGVQLLSERKGWNKHPRLARPREGRGGGMEYRVELLPLDVRMHLLARFAEPEAGAIEAGAAPDASPGLATQAQTERDARLHVLGQFKAWHRHVGLKIYTAVSTFCDLWNAGMVEAPGWVAECLPSLSKRSVWRWLSASRRGSVDDLAVDRGAARRGKGVLDEAEGGSIRAHILTLYAHQPHLSADHLRTMCRDRFGDVIQHRGKSVPMPTVRMFQRVLKRLKTEHRAELLALHNPDAFKSRMRVSGSSAHLVTRLNELWQIDASPADVLCKDGRHSIYVCVDVWSRRMITFVSRTPRAEAVGMLLKKALLAWGVPERIKTDNGSDFVARATKRLLAALRIEVETSAPFSPEQKGVVERAIGTLQRDFMPLLPGFIGHSVADRKAIENRKAFSRRLGQDDAGAFQVDLSASELAGYLDRLVADRYHQRPHGGLPKGMTPFLMASRSTLAIRSIDDEAALAVLLAPVAGKDGLRIYGKMGLRIEGSHYLAPGVMPGETLFVRMDPADLGRAYLFAEDGESFRAIAICPELAGIDPAAALAAAQAAQKAFIAERVAPIRRDAAKIKKRGMVDSVLRQAAKDAGTLVELPKRREPHATPALSAAAETANALDISKGLRAPKASEPSEAEKAMLAKLEAANDAAITSPAPVVRPLRKHETPHQRFRRALDLEAAIAASEPVSTEDALWLGSYREGAEYRAHKRLHKEFGETALR
ncbi:MAG: transposase [Rhizobiales bacterium]|nr:transposase [Hyphomicrobiales bacterium]